MRTQEVTILGKKYLMNFSNSVLVYMEQNGIKLEQMGESDTPVSVMIEIVSRMIKSGARYSRMTGGPDYPEISAEDLAEGTDIQQLQELMMTATYCISGQRTIDAVPKKKEAEAETAQMN